MREACSHFREPPRRSQPRGSTGMGHTKRETRRAPPWATACCSLRATISSLHRDAERVQSSDRDRVLRAQLIARLSSAAADLSPMGKTSGARWWDGWPGSRAHLKPAEVVSQPSSASVLAETSMSCSTVMSRASMAMTPAMGAHMVGTAQGDALGSAR